MEAILNFDLSVFAFIREYMWSPIMDTLMVFYTHLGEGGYVSIVIGLALLIPKKTRKAGFSILISLAVMGIFNNEILKPIIARPRPFFIFDPDAVNQYMADSSKYEVLIAKCTQAVQNFPELAADWAQRFVYPELVERPSSWSFPSGHTSSIFAVAMGLTMAVKSKAKVGIPAFILAAIMGFTRIYVHVHYCTDVLVGAAVGVIYGLIGYLIANWLYNKFYDKIEAKVVEIINKKKSKA